MWLWGMLGATARSTLGGKSSLTVGLGLFLDWEGIADFSSFGGDLFGKHTQHS